MRSAANNSAIVDQSKLRGPLASGTNRRRSNTCRINEPMGPELGSQVSTTSAPRLLMALASNLACVVLPEPSMPSTTTNKPGKRRPEFDARGTEETLWVIAERSLRRVFLGCNRWRIFAQHHVVDEPRLAHETSHGEQ